MVIVSVGTLLLAFVMDGGRSLFVGFYYLLHSTVVTGALFLIADLIGTQRGIAMDQIVRARPVNQATLLGGFFSPLGNCRHRLAAPIRFCWQSLAVAVAGRLAEQVWVWPALLISSLMALVAFTRAGSTFFWHVSPQARQAARTRG
jgi:multicomponent K+:H+ antiporter subunit D